MKISKVDVARPEGSFYELTITGEGFGDRPGELSVWMPDQPDFHVNPVKWSDTEITAMVSDVEMGVPGLMPGATAMIEVIPVPGMVSTFEVFDPNQDEEAQTAEEAQAAEEVHTADYDGLVARAEALGVKVDKRWGEDRLRQEVASAEASASE